MLIVDAHEDLAWNMLEFGRDYMRSAAETRVLEAGSSVNNQNGTTMIGWPDWVEGKVAVVFATLFSMPDRRCTGGWEKIRYSSQSQAAAQYLGQMDFYHSWVDANPEKLGLVKTRSDLDRVLGTWNAESADPVVGLLMLMEGADAVERPEDISAWYGRGLRMLGPAWTGTVYAGGTREPGPFTNAGLELLDAMAEVNMILDISHLSEQGCLQALDSYEGPVAASHGNPAGMVNNSSTPERFFTDDVILHLAERGGVVGVTAYNRFLRGDWKREDGRDEFSIHSVVEHMDYICQLTGSSACVGLGTDFDGGLGLEDTPADLDTVADLQLIGNGLEEYGYSFRDIEAILSGNWIDFLEKALPE